MACCAMMPASKARRPASIPSLKARAICTGACACATAEFSNTASKPSSMACTASRGEPIPASMISGTPGSRARRVRNACGLSSPCPEPMGAPHGIRMRQPASSSRWQVTRSSVQYGNTSKPARTNSVAAFTSSNGSGCNVYSSPTTSSLIHGVSNNSRAMCAKVTASRAARQPAVLGNSRTPVSRMMP